VPSAPHMALPGRCWVGGCCVLEGWVREGVCMCLIVILVKKCVVVAVGEKDLHRTLRRGHFFFQKK